MLIKDQYLKVPLAKCVKEMLQKEWRKCGDCRGRAEKEGGEGEIDEHMGEDGSWVYAKHALTDNEGGYSIRSVD